MWKRHVKVFLFALYGLFGGLLLFLANLDIILVFITKSVLIYLLSFIFLLIDFCKNEIIEWLSELNKLWQD